jgi:hypothetical protein
LTPTGAEQLYLLCIWRFGSPHARASGKNLERIRSGLMSPAGGAFQRTAVVGVNANAHFVSITGGFEGLTLLN